MLHSNSKKSFNAWTILYSGLIVLGLLSSFFILRQILVGIIKLNIPFDTDEADHANSALEIYWNLTNGTISSLFTAISKQSFYPPLHGIITALFYKVFDITLTSSRISSFLFLIGSVLAFTYCVIRSNNLKLRSLDSIFTLSITSLLFTTNIIFIENSALCMLELQGVFLCMLILLLTTANISIISCVTISICSFLLFLTKYNFGLFIIPAIAYCYALLNRRYALLYSILIGTFITLWLSITNVDSFKYFLTGHPSYAPIFSSNNLLFELKAWIFEYHQSIYVAIILTLLAFLNLAKPQKNFTQLFCVYGVIGTLVILLMSTTNESRHFILAAPLMWFLAVSFLVQKESLSTISKAIQIVILVLTIYSSIDINSNIRKLVIKGMEGNPTYDQAIGFLANKVDPKLPALVIGNHDRLSIETIQWYTARQFNLPYSAMKFDSFPFDTDKVANAIKRGRNSDDWFADNNIPSDPFKLINSGHYKQILIFRRIGSSDDKAKLIKFFTEIPQKTSIARKIFGSYEAIYITMR